MGSDIRTAELHEPVDVGEYLVRRLYEVGIRSVHGVPGDFNLRFLDYIPEHGLKWVGNVNELNAGYAADGYARVKGIAALVTTFGVGELSALNAIGGAFSEYVPVVHVVGCPSTASQRDGMLLHHTLGNGDFRVFANISRDISVATALLGDAQDDAATRIDHAIRECYVQSRPVYVALPTDLVERKVEGARLKTPLDLSFPPNDPKKEDYVVDVVLKSLYAAKNPVILVDACAIRHRALEETRALISHTQLPTFVAPMGKGAIDETSPTYGGVYAGSGSDPGVRARVEAADLILSVGAIKSDFNTAGFTYRVSPLTSVDFHSSYVRVRYSEYPGVRMNGVLRKLCARLDASRLSVQAGPAPPDNAVPAADEAEGKGWAAGTVTQAWFWPRVGAWLRERDLVITETGTANFGVWGTRFPRGVTAISQVLWGSIGYATGSCQGAALAARETGDVNRTILFTGDGSFQLTAQELSTMIRLNLNPIIFIICNEGYTIERYIHGWDAAYNDIQTWNNTALPAAFGATDKQAATYQVRTKKEVDALFEDETFASSDKLRLVEVYMPKEDAPAALKSTAEATSKRNAEM